MLPRVMGREGTNWSGEGVRALAGRRWMRHIFFFFFFFCVCEDGFQMANCGVRLVLFVLLRLSRARKLSIATGAVLFF